MAAIVQLVQWFNGPTIRIHPDDNVGARRVEERNDIGRREKILLILFLTIFIISSISLICYLSIATTVLDNTHPTLQTDVKTMSVTYHDEDDKVVVSLETSLKVGFYVPHVIMARPGGVAKFSMSTKLNKTHTLRAFATSRFKVDVNHDQLLFLNFLTEQMSADLIRKTSDKEFIWIRLTGDLKMKVKMAKFPMFPHAYQHMYLMCVVTLNASEPAKIYSKKSCETSVLKPFES